MYETKMSYSEHFSVKNIPYGIATGPGHTHKSVATRLHDKVLFLKDLDIQSDEEIQKAITQSTLNALAGVSKDKLKELRATLQKLLADDSVVSKHGVPVDQVQMHLPLQISGFTDFSCSIAHLGNAAAAMTGERNLPPAMLYHPIGYNGRPSSVVVSGTPVVRPYGQYYGASAAEILFGPCQAFDFELEVACVIGKPSKLGERISVTEADDYIFGVVLVNDWSGMLPETLPILFMTETHIDNWISSRHPEV